MPAGGDCLEGKREAKVQVSTECDAGRQAGEAGTFGRKAITGGCKPESSRACYGETW